MEQGVEYWNVGLEKTKMYDREKKKAYQRQWVKDNPLLVKAYQKKQNEKLKAQTMSNYSKGQPECARCGITDIDVLTIDHINGGGNKHRKQLGFGNGCGLAFYRWLRQNSFPEGYQVLCFNCNMKKQIREHC